MLVRIASDTVVTATLLYAEPSDRNTIDNDNGSGMYVFDEMALRRCIWQRKNLAFNFSSIEKQRIGN
jgi:hypothetical protein